MIRNLPLITFLLILSIADVAAQRRQAFPRIPGHALPAGISVAEFQKKLQGIMYAARGTTGPMLKTTSGGERVIAQSRNDFFLVPGGELGDSVFLKYSGNQTSAFDFDYLRYDFENRTDEPGPFRGSSYVHFDTGFGFNYIGPYSYGRSYNASGKVIRSEFTDELRKLYTYNAQGNLIKSLSIEYNSSSGAVIDSSSRNFYTYNSAGHLLVDSGEKWDKPTSSWKPEFTIGYTLNAAGNPVHVLITSYLNAVPRPFYQYDFVYNAANLPVLISIKYDDTFGNFVNSHKDSFGYAGNMRVLHRIYEWDKFTSEWGLTYEQTRHLNAASLPDSLMIRQIYSSGFVDTSIQKLAYNAQGNPVSLGDFNVGSPNPNYEIRWYYEAHNGVGVSSVTARKNLTVYPNPAIDVLYVKSDVTGRYIIQNMVGQILQSGTLRSATGIPVSPLAPGVYSLSIHDNDGVVRATQFIRQ